MKVRLDQLLVARKVVSSRSQADSYIRLGKVRIREQTARASSSDSFRGSSNARKLDSRDKRENDDAGWRIAKKSGEFVDKNAEIDLLADEQFVSRAGLKLKSVAEKLRLDFREKIVLDVGSSTGGFTEFALSRGAKKVIAVDVGTEQLHPKLRGGEFAKKIELHEKTDIREVYYDCRPELPVRHPEPTTRHPELDSGSSKKAVAKGDTKSAWIPDQVRNDGAVIIRDSLDLVLIDVSFISLREILPHIAKHLANPQTDIVAMVKPQFETGAKVKNAGVVKNETERREILKNFELWSRQFFVIKNKMDSEVAGTRGNRERFYRLKIIAK
jgi:23S rRNA (cytidine1920-2'-O)/16S rRNA (cytidine1409-2'-O)-methyltransferase